ncbi:phage scaffolding protein [uncultured Tyzzerella sp.]|uniref:phage scaffolding protein n=1 Tax=uncultured Tyzzerella sp. TaxID=2321398 RepID=UPI002942A174|nr:phage scaffolding protein [uncultured Tyzzerella sp.]
MDIKYLMDLGIEKPKAEEIYCKIEKYIFEKMKEKTKEYENKILELELKMTVERQLFMAKAKNIKATMALIDFNKLDSKNIDEKAIKNMIDELKNNEETKFLFNEDEDNKITGFKPIESSGKNISRGQLSYEELCKYYEKGIF